MLNMDLCTCTLGTFDLFFLGNVCIAFTRVTGRKGTECNPLRGKCIILEYSNTIIYAVYTNFKYVHYVYLTEAGIYIFLRLHETK